MLQVGRLPAAVFAGTVMVIRSFDLPHFHGYISPWSAVGVAINWVWEVAMRIAAAMVVVWLIIGVVASVQRNYVTGSVASCALVGTVAITMLVGPLNCVGFNPQISCEVASIVELATSPLRIFPPCLRGSLGYERRQRWTAR
ncbi:hypothetical protein [Pseudonocardia sp. T1-2H]|uniref:hypothetical protein n=1 Tax=Pseudonocardia sp. T1-2H TaxID=3128899 RepID=UPI0031018A19